MFGPSVANAGASITTLVRTMRRDRQKDATAEVRADVERVLPAVLELECCTAAVLARLVFLRGVRRPPLRGAAWTWPAVYRAYRSFPALVEELHRALIHVMTVAPGDLREKTLGLFAAVGVASQQFTASDLLFQSKSDEAYDALGELVGAVRLWGDV